MDATLKAKWVEALRSGEYKQAHATLKDDHGGYCCLGVLCEIAGLKINAEGTGVLVKGEIWKNNYDPIFKLVGGSQKSGDCSMRNDGTMEDHNARKWTFAEIADYIEANL